MKHLITAAHNVIQWGNPNKLTDAQREELTVAVLKDAGNSATDYVENCLLGTTLTDKLIEALQESNIADRNVLLKDIGEMFLKEAIKSCNKQKKVNEALELAQSQIAYDSGLISEGALELQRLIADDNRQRI